MSQWVDVRERLPEDHEYVPSDENMVDVWMNVPASPLSFGMADSFRVPDAWREKGKWVHRHMLAVEELRARYITHWMPRPDPPRNDA